MELRALDLMPAAALALLGGWQLISLAWSPGPTEPVLEAERTLVYLALALAAPLVVPARGAPWLAAGLVAGTTAVAAWALATRLFPDALVAFDPLRLAEPIGYWNALGLLAVLGLLLALGAAAAAPPAGRAAAAAAVPLLATTLALTFSRGAWLALGVGLVALAVLEPRRLRAAALVALPAAAGAAAVAAALSLDGLTREDATLPVARADGRVLAVALGAAVLLGAAAALVAATVERRWQPSRAARRAAALGLAVVAAAGVLGALVAIGNPAAAASRAVDAFRAPLPAAGADLGGRLAHVSGNGRADYWRVAWNEVEDEPVLGGGSGSYERRWLLERPTSFAARDAHNLYLETLAELGPVGLLLLLAALAPPLLALPRARPAAAAGAAYVAFLAHAALDWDWEIPAVTGAALLAGRVVVATVGGAPERRPGGRERALGLALLLPLAAAAAIAHAGNRAAAEVEDAIAHDDPPRAAAAAARARRFAPWSTEALRLSAEARLAAGDRRGAQAFLREAIRRDPRSWELWYALSFAEEGAAAGRATARARALNPRAPELASIP